MWKEGNNNRSNKDESKKGGKKVTPKKKFIFTIYCLRHKVEKGKNTSGYTQGRGKKKKECPLWVFLLLIFLKS